MAFWNHVQSGTSWVHRKAMNDQGLELRAGQATDHYISTVLC